MNKKLKPRPAEVSWVIKRQIRMMEAKRLAEEAKRAEDAKSDGEEKSTQE